MSKVILTESVATALGCLASRLELKRSRLDEKRARLSAQILELDSEISALCCVAEPISPIVSEQAISTDFERDDDRPKNKRPSTPHMILNVLEDHREFGLEARLIADIALIRWNLDMNWKRFASECRRLYNEGRLVQDKDSRRYRISE